MLKNFAFYYWVPNRWRFHGRFVKPQDAVANPHQPGKDRTRGCVIDLVTGRQIWRDGKYCDRAKPVGIHSLPAFEKYEAQPTAEALNQPVITENREIT